MQGQPKTAYVTPEEYLAAERAAETRHEYFNGEIIALTGASRADTLIVVNIAAAFHSQFRGRACETYTQDMRVKVSRTGMYTYPDVAVVCGEPELEDEQFDTLLNPTLIVEVLSPSTAPDDRHRKWNQYRRLQSLQEYLLVAQDVCAVERYTRQQGGLWSYSETAGRESAIELPAMGARLALDEIYDRVEVPEA